MKRSNKILIIVVLLPISWLLLNGWLQANAFKLISSGKTCSYAGLSVNDIVKHLQPYKNIKIDFEKDALSLHLVIKYGKKQELTCSNNVLKAISYNVSGDTLYLRIKNVPNESDVFSTNKSDIYFNISVPLLKSVDMTSVSDITKDKYFYNNNSISIMGFKANTLFINYNCQYGLFLLKNKLTKLELKGDFYKDGKVELSDYTDYDSLDVDIVGKYGTLRLTPNPQKKVNPKQWVSIKVPGTFNIEGDSFIASKIIINK